MRSIIITGSSSGIGFEAALYLARMAPTAQLVLPCINLESAKKTVERIRLNTGHTHLVGEVMDLSSLQSIRDFKDRFESQPHNTVIALINNAGVQYTGTTKYTTEGFEYNFGVNHLGPFYLTQMLIPLMADDATISFTSSGTHDPSERTPIGVPVYTTAGDLAYPKETHEKDIVVGQRRYSTSKLCNVMTVYGLQRALSHTNIRVNAFDPGLTPGTGLVQSYSSVFRFMWKYVMPILILFKRNTYSPRRSGVTLAKLACAPEFKELKGIYYSDGKVRLSSRDSYNDVFQKELWESSMKLTGLSA